MPLKLVLDENLRHDAIKLALQSHHARGGRPLDVVRVGDADAPALGTSDSDLILWAASSQRIIVTLDSETLVRDLAAHVQMGHRSPGAIILRRGLSAEEVVMLFDLISYDSSAGAWSDGCQWLP